MPCPRFLRHLLLPGLLACPLASFAQTTPAPGPPAESLKPGRAVTQRLQGGQSYTYQIALKAGQALKATVDQQGIDVVATTYAPDGTELASFDSPTGDADKEFVTLVATAAGRYRLAVRALEPGAPAGTFVLVPGPVLSPAQYAQSLADDRARADTLTAYLRAPHPDKTSDEQYAEVVRLDPTVLMVKPKQPALAATRWLAGAWTSKRKIFATPTRPEVTMPPNNIAIRFSPANRNQLEFDWEADGKFQPVMVFEPLGQQWVTAYMSGNDQYTSWALLKGLDWQDNRLVLEGEAAYMGTVGHQRRTWTKVDDRTLRVFTEERKPDGSWQPIAETQYTKTTPAALTAE